MKQNPPSPKGNSDAKRQPFAQVPLAFIEYVRCGKLQPGDPFIWSIMRNYQKCFGGELAMSIERIAEHCGVSKTTMRRTIKRLQETGLLEVEFRSDGTAKRTTEVKRRCSYRALNVWAQSDQTEEAFGPKRPKRKVQNGPNACGAHNMVSRASEKKEEVKEIGCSAPPSVPGCTTRDAVQSRTQGAGVAVKEPQPWGEDALREIEEVLQRSGARYGNADSRRVFAQAVYHILDYYFAQLETHLPQEYYDCLRNPQITGIDEIDFIRTADFVLAGGNYAGACFVLKGFWKKPACEGEVLIRPRNAFSNLTKAIEIQNRYQRPGRARRERDKEERARCPEKGHEQTPIEIADPRVSALVSKGAASLKLPDGIESRPGLN